MSRQESNAHYKSLPDHDEHDAVESPPVQKRSLAWIGYAVMATTCFALSAYLLGILSLNGISAKFLNSYGFLFISLMILVTRNIKFTLQRMKYNSENPPKKRKRLFARLKDTCFYDTKHHCYKWD